MNKTQILIPNKFLPQTHLPTYVVSRSKIEMHYLKIMLPNEMKMFWKLFQVYLEFFISLLNLIVNVVKYGYDIFRNSASIFNVKTKFVFTYFLFLKAWGICWIMVMPQASFLSLLYEDTNWTLKYIDMLYCLQRIMQGKKKSEQDIFLDIEHWSMVQVPYSSS